jgi:hypothetical protein
VPGSLNPCCWCWPKPQARWIPGHSRAPGRLAFTHANVCYHLCCCCRHRLPAAAATAQRSSWRTASAPSQTQT